MSKYLTGSCLCKAVQYRVPDEFRYSGFCHCSECRKFSGSAFSAFAGIETGKFEVTHGAEHIRSYAKPRVDEEGKPMSPATTMKFCECCGSSLLAQKHERGMVHLRMGTLDDAPTLHLMGHVHVASKAPWYEIGDNRPQMDEAPTKARAIVAIASGAVYRMWHGAVNALSRKPKVKPEVSR